MIWLLLGVCFGLYHNCEDGLNGKDYDLVGRMCIKTLNAEHLSNLDVHAFESFHYTAFESMDSLKMKTLLDSDNILNAFLDRPHLCRYITDFSNLNISLFSRMSSLCLLEIPSFAFKTITASQLNEMSEISSLCYTQASEIPFELWPEFTKYSALEPNVEYKLNRYSQIARDHFKRGHTCRAIGRSVQEISSPNYGKICRPINSSRRAKIFPMLLVLVTLINWLI